MPPRLELPRISLANLPLASFLPLPGACREAPKPRPGSRREGGTGLGRGYSPNACMLFEQQRAVWPNRVNAVFLRGSV